MKKKARGRYVVCVRSDGAEDLEVRKVYRVLADESAAARGHLRVVDESGEDYLYPAEWFVAVELPEKVEQLFATKSPARPSSAR
jgi:hypothetical protein